MPDVRDYGADGGTGTPTFSLTTEPGDLVLVLHSSRASDTTDMSAPSAPGVDSWQLVAEADVSYSPPSRMWYGEATTSGAQTITCGSGSNSVMAVYSIHNHDAITPIADSSGNAVGETTTASHTALSVNAETDEPLLIGQWTGVPDFDGTAYSSPPGMTDGVTAEAVQSGFTFCTIHTARQTLAGSGATGNRTATYGRSSTYSAILVAIRAGVTEPPAQPVDPEHIVASASIASATVTAGAVTLSPDRIPAAAVVNPADATPGSAEIAPETIAATASVHQPSLSAGSVTLTPESIAQSAAAHAPVLTPGAVTLSPESVGPVAIVAAPSVAPGAAQVDAGHIPPAAVVRDAQVSSETVLTPELVTPTPVVHDAVVVSGSVTLSPGHIAASPSVLDAAVSGEAVVPTLTPEHVPASAVVFNHAVSAGPATVTAARIEPMSVVHPAAVFEPGAITSWPPVFGVFVQRLLSAGIIRPVAEPHATVIVQARITAGPPTHTSP